jgi:DNA-binding beta-propeller fold protein YncE
MRQALIAATALLALAACSGATSPTNPSAAMPALARPASSSNLYVADQGLNAVVEFDSQGKKVAQKSLGQTPLDVITDSRGNVYLLTAERAVHEFTHDLGRVIRQYSLNSDDSVALAIDAGDNLYVEGRGYSARDSFVAKYAYGSSKVEKIYKFPCAQAGEWRTDGIAVRGDRLFCAFGGA